MTVEILTPANHFPRMAELRSLGAVIPYWKVGPNLCDWTVQWYWWHWSKMIEIHTIIESGDNRTFERD